MQTQGKLTLLVSGFAELQLLPPASALASGLLCSSPQCWWLSHLPFFPFSSTAAFFPAASWNKPREKQNLSFSSWSLIFLLSHLALITPSFHSNVEAFVTFFFFLTSNLIGCSQVSECISLQNSFHSVVQYCLECYKLNLQKTYSLISIHLPLLSNAFRCSHPLFKSVFLIFSSEAHSSCSSRPAYLQPAGKARKTPQFTHHPLHHAAVSFAPTLLCADGARSPLFFVLTSIQQKIQ